MSINDRYLFHLQLKNDTELLILALCSVVFFVVCYKTDPLFTNPSVRVILLVL